MKLNQTYKTILKSLIVAPIVAGGLASLIFWFGFIISQGLDIGSQLQASIEATKITLSYGLVFWAIAAPIGLIFGLYFIGKDQILIRLVYAILAVPVPVLYMSDYVKDRLNSTGSEVIFSGLVFGISSTLLLTFLTRNIELPVKSNTNPED